ncbi:hypothetical protein BU26DRAFT_596977 [Trematosphaeria pertusa]|uniref:HTH psq-type domain-containing protein n=1 Tax=Trematosphaeria pertusa TaxID=390896 RepID=A0A6A6I9V5_9PLEO|nr:uncharacterized protein BU26DRAFT_596977 [Trematosphaeria pertusa]KAF2247166.1 hypothetical protein BU26DRAFT_596977 [Trematosphaeria pertusa]
MGDIEAVLKALKLLKIDEKPNYKKIAEEYGVSRTTLSWRYKGVQGTVPTRKIADNNASSTLRKNQSLYPTTKEGLPSKEMIRNLAPEIAEKEAGKS